jgi:PAS domain S-box-containing protein
MDQDKDRYIEQELTKITNFWLSVGLVLGAFVITFLNILDRFADPENATRFLLYRLACSFSMLVLFLINRKHVNKTSQNLIIISSTVLTSVTVELMILSSGGHQSTYYAGIVLTLVFVLGFIPCFLKTAMFIVAIAYSIYFIPIILFDNISNMQTFIGNNAFLLSTASVTIVIRFLNQKRLTSELALQYELNKEKQKLEQYSSHLEELVQERTKELSISEKWHRSIFDNATDGIVILDRNGVIVNVNQKACELHGFQRDALIGVNIGLLEVKGEKEKINDRLTQILDGEMLTYEIEHYRKDGEKVLFEVSSNRIQIEGQTYVQSFYRDITEKKKIQEQLMHSQKMESVGALAGGIAHNFNNILTAILGYAELLLEYSNLDETSNQRVRNIESSARKAGIMVSKLLSFARRESHEILPLNLNDVVNDSLKLFEGVLNKRIGLKINLSNINPLIEGDPNQLEQIIMNLMVNAKDAMPDGGLISIKTSAVEVDKSDRQNIPAYIEPGKYALLTVSDTGCGIPKAIINRIFDPFFTTKEKGKGTGLGLATVYGIVKDHRGYIFVQSEPDKGTTFDIYLPVSEKSLYKVVKPQPVSVEGNENILVVDDDKDVLKFITEILETHGYSVISASNSLTAIDIFKNFSGKIPLVITDVIMPLMEGSDLIKYLKRINPDLKIIVVSGYSDESISKDASIDVFLRKPFESMELLTSVRRLLDADTRKLPLY